MGKRKVLAVHAISVLSWVNRKTLTGLSWLTSISLSAIGVNPAHYSSHSLRRGGATFAFCRDAPTAFIKAQGDWKSDAYFNLLIYLSSMLLNYRFSFVYQWSHRLLPPCFNEYFKFTSPVNVHSYSMRQSCNRNLYIISVNTTQYGLHSLKFTCPRLWNSLPISVSNSNSLRVFRKTLKNSMLNCYSI